MGCGRIGKVAHGDAVVNLEAFRSSAPLASGLRSPQGFLSGLIPRAVVAVFVVGAPTSQGRTHTGTVRLTPSRGDGEFPATLGTHPQAFGFDHESASTRARTEAILDPTSCARCPEELPAAGDTSLGCRLRTSVGAGAGAEAILPVHDGELLPIEARSAGFTGKVLARPLRQTCPFPECGIPLVNTLGHDDIIPRRLESVN